MGIAPFRTSAFSTASNDPTRFSCRVGTTLEHTEKPKCHSNDECQAVIKVRERRTEACASGAGKGNSDDMAWMPRASAYPSVRNL